MLVDDIPDHAVNDFYRSRMGHTFFEAALPRLVAVLAPLNDLVARGLAIAERAYPPSAPAPGTPMTALAGAPTRWNRSRPDPASRRGQVDVLGGAHHEVSLEDHGSAEDGDDACEEAIEDEELASPTCRVQRCFSREKQNAPP